jgi:hypothetical protein
MNLAKTLIAAAISSVVLAGSIPVAFAAASTCATSEGCDINVNNTATSNVTNTTTNVITTTFNEASMKAGLALQSVYQATGSYAQKNTGDVTSIGRHDALITTGKGDVSIDATAIGNNFSAQLTGLKSVNLSAVQQNTGDITAINVVTHPKIGGNLEVSSTAIGNNASVNWDLTTDKNPSSNNFDVKRDGEIRSFSNVGTYVGSLEQCNTGNIYSTTNYMQDPAANIKISTTAIANNISIGVKTR